MQFDKQFLSLDAFGWFTKWRLNFVCKVSTSSFSSWFLLPIALGAAEKKWKEATRPPICRRKHVLRILISRNRAMRYARFCRFSRIVALVRLPRKRAPISPQPPVHRYRLRATTHLYSDRSNFLNNIKNIYEDLKIFSNELKLK